MCGLFGVAGQAIEAKHRAAFTQLCYASALRGFDATGIAAVVEKKNERGNRIIYLHKNNTCASDFIAEKDYNLILRTNPVVLIGHARARTVGTNIPKNAHPYIYENLVGAHNGTLSGYYQGANDYGTDSAWLYSQIDAKGLEKTIGRVEGAWALSWFDQTNDTINFLRNKERDLFFAKETGSDVVFWASERGLLSWILPRNGINVDKYVRLKTNTHVRYNPFEKDGLDKYSMTECKGKERIADVTDDRFFQEFFKTIETRKKKKEIADIKIGATNQNQVGALSAKSGSLPAPVSVTGFVPPSAQITNSGKSVIPFAPDVTQGTSLRKNMAKGFKGFLLTREEVEESLKDGCVYCGHVTKFGEPFRWINHNDYLCARCKDSMSFTAIKCTDAAYFEDLVNE